MTREQVAERLYQAALKDSGVNGWTMGEQPRNRFTLVLADTVLGMIAEAVQAEREGCALVAGDSQFADDRRETRHDTAVRIADRIRARTP